MRFYAHTALNKHQNKTWDCAAKEPNNMYDILLVLVKLGLTAEAGVCNSLLFIRKSKNLFQKVRFSCLNCGKKNLPSTSLKKVFLL